MRSHKHKYSSSSQFHHPSSVYGDNSVFNTLRSNTSIASNLHNTHRPPRHFHSTSNLTKSSGNLVTLDKKANADPMLKGVRKSRNGYHLSVDLKAHLLNGLQRPASSMQLQNNSSQQRQLQQHTSIRSDFERSASDMARLNGGSRVSMVNLHDPSPRPIPPPIISHPRRQSSNQRLVINLEGSRHSHPPPSNSTSDNYIMKSIRSSEARREERRVKENKENIEFDLCLFGTVNKKVEKIISEPAPQPKVVKKEGESRAKGRKVIEETEVRTQVGIPSLNIRPPKPSKRPQEKISKGMVDNLNSATYQLEEEEEVMLQRLLRGAPADSYKKHINVERETEEIFGPLPEEEIEKLYAKEMINVDVISEAVHLELVDGVADLQLRLTFNKIVPVDGSRDTFKMTKVVVSKQVLVDLRVTEERRRVYEEVMQVQRDGVLDSEYTWMLYRIFSTLADTHKSLGVSEGRVRVEKEVDEERVYDLNREMFKARGNTGKKFQILEDTFLTSDERSDLSRHSSSEHPDASRTASGWSYHNGQRPSMVARERNILKGAYTPYKHALSRQETPEPKDFFSQVDAQQSTARINKASSNLHQPGDPDWKRQFSRWLSSEQEQESKVRAHRMDVHTYLRPGGSRNYDYLIHDAYNTNNNINNNTNSNSNNTRNNNSSNTKREEAMMDSVLESVGLRGGSHRERMRSYERGLERGGDDDDRMQTSHHSSRTSRKERYTRDVL